MSTEEKLRMISESAAASIERLIIHLDLQIDISIDDLDFDILAWLQNHTSDR